LVGVLTTSIIAVALQLPQQLQSTLFAEQVHAPYGLQLAFIAGTFVASPELRAYAANTVCSSDIIDESILSQDIKNGEVKNSNIAQNAVTISKIAAKSLDGSKIPSNSKT